MPIDPLTLALLGGGTALNAIGGLVGGASANRAGREARDFADRDLLGGQGNLGVSLYGDQAAYLPTLRRLLGEAQQHNNPAEAARIGGEISTAMRPTSTSILGRQAAVGDNIVGQQGDDLTRFDTDSDRIERLFGNAAAGMRGEGDRLNRLAGGAESMASNFGVGRDRIIRQDAAKRGKAMDQQTRAQLAGSGFSNTTALPAAMAGNARTVAEAEDRALQDSQDARLAAVLQARERRIATGQGVASNNYGADINTAQAVAGRSTQRTGLRSAHLANEQALRMLPIDTELGVNQGSIMNPHLNANTAQYYPGASGGGGALSSIGSTMTGAGGIMLGNMIRPGAPAGNPQTNTGGSSTGFAGWGGEMERMRRLMGGG